MEIHINNNNGDELTLEELLADGLMKISEFAEKLAVSGISNGRVASVVNLGAIDVFEEQPHIGYLLIFDQRLRQPKLLLESRRIGSG